MAIQKTRDGLKIIAERFGVDPAQDPGVQSFADEFRIAQIIYDARQVAGLTQQQLAVAVGVAEEVINDLEDANYTGGAWEMLHRVADALHLQIHIELVPAAR